MGYLEHRSLLCYGLSQWQGWAASVRDPIPTIAIPLRPGDPEPTLPLNAQLHELYDRAGYDLVIDYSHSPEPPLSAADRKWIRQRLASQREG